MKACVILNGKLSDELPVDNNVKHGDILGPTLFSFFFASQLYHAFPNWNKGILLQFKISGQVFNLWIFKARSTTFQFLIKEFPYVEDADFVTKSCADILHFIDYFWKSGSKFGLKISLRLRSCSFKLKDKHILNPLFWWIFQV